MLFVYSTCESKDTSHLPALNLNVGSCFLLEVQIAAGSTSNVLPSFDVSQHQNILRQTHSHHLQYPRLKLCKASYDSKEYVSRPPLLVQNPSRTEKTPMKIYTPLPALTPLLFHSPFVLHALMLFQYPIPSGFQLAMVSGFLHFRQSPSTSCRSFLVPLSSSGPRYAVCTLLLNVSP